MMDYRPKPKRFAPLRFLFGEADEDTMNKVLERDPRCKMISLDPDTAEHNPEILRKVAQGHGNCAGVYCAVLIEGVLTKGDTIELLD